jgi:zinc/manganese transport system permease protein
VNLDALDLSILGPALLAGMLVLSTHVPLGQEVLNRGIIFIDLAIAQVAGLGVIAANMLDLAHGIEVQAAAVTAALVAAALLTWTEKKFGESQEALIGVLFILGATGGLILLANDPHGGEELRGLLAGQILWVEFTAIGYVAMTYAAILAIWFGVGKAQIGRAGFYVLFAFTVTASVQLVGVYLVFASLIIPALAARLAGAKHHLVFGLALGTAGYALGLTISALFDLPGGAVIVWTLAGLGIASSFALRFFTKT